MKILYYLRSMNRKEEIEDLKKSTREELDKIYSELPGGKTAFILGIVLAFVIAIIGTVNFLWGLAAVGLLGVVLLFYIKGMLDISPTAEGILITSIAFLPIFILVFLVFWAVTALISGIVLLFL